MTHGCIIAQVKLYMNDIEVPGHEPPIQQALKVVKVSELVVGVCVRKYEGMS